MNNKKDQCESMGNTIDKEMPDEKIYRYELQGLERKLVNLETTVNTLTALYDVLAKVNGIKVDRFKGVIVITKVWFRIYVLWRGSLSRLNPRWLADTVIIGSLFTNQLSEHNIRGGEYEDTW